MKKNGVFADTHVCESSELLGHFRRLYETPNLVQYGTLLKLTGGGDDVVASDVKTGQTGHHGFAPYEDPWLGGPK